MVQTKQICTRKHTIKQQTQHLVTNFLTSFQSEKRHNLCLLNVEKILHLSVNQNMRQRSVFLSLNYTTSEWQCPNKFMIRWLRTILLTDRGFLKMCGRRI